ncbi:hypothetical protein CH352_15435 [Leptospira hartskeerlii]|uniref:Uncharacterized protein n=1 Tax=Leptospira hartskeerlii TaxID=2023177 RepID=A0A2M9XC78_9LEPT|nr:tetratricopeptide repeat protein [Leptospira hartskeerlii]PJZ25307.1 hypothetical protein CH357_10250 [Leptospira hartskeerlii]PJZ32713.1 hypothetical protein CH352_15435 [Leptospira hartskeerlii]
MIGSKISNTHLNLKFLFRNFAVLFVLSFSFSLYSKQTIDWIKEGEGALASRNYPAAYDSFREAVNLNPLSVRSRLGLAEAALKLHKEKEALQSLDKVLELEPKNKKAVREKAITLAKLGRYEEAFLILKPFLEEDRYDSDLFPIYIEVQLASGKTQKASFEFHSAYSRIPKSKEVKTLEAKVEAFDGNFTKAAYLRNQLEAEASDDPAVFLESGKFLLIWAEKSQGSKRDSKIAEAAEKFERSVSLHPNEEEALKLLAKTRIYFGRYQEAEEYLNRLLGLFPNSTEYLYLRSYSRLKKDPTSKDAKTDLEKLISLDDLDPIARNRSELYALENLPEGNSLRRTLGEYRLQRYRANKNAFLYDLAWYHLIRAKELLPNRPEILVLTLEEYKRRGLFPSYFNLLLLLRDKFPDNKKYGYSVENNLEGFKTSLSYREGLVKIGEFGIQEDYGRTPPEVLVFDPDGEDFLAKHTDLPALAGKVLRHFLNSDPRIRNIDLDNIRKSESLESEPYSGAIHKTEKNYSSIKNSRGENARFVVSGKISFQDDNLRIEWSLRDHKEEKILGKFRIYAKGRDALAEATLRARDKILALIPASGKVHRVKEDSLIVNAGIIDGLKKGTTVYFFNSATLLGEGTVTEADLYTAKVVPKNQDAVLRNIAVGNKAYWKKTENPASN